MAFGTYTSEKDCLIKVLKKTLLKEILGKIAAHSAYDMFHGIST